MLVVGIFFEVRSEIQVYINHQLYKCRIHAPYIENIIHLLKLTNVVSNFNDCRIWFPHLPLLLATYFF